jgi:hypothetical protein
MVAAETRTEPRRRSVYAITHCIAVTLPVTKLPRSWCYPSRTCLRNPTSQKWWTYFKLKKKKSRQVFQAVCGSFKTILLAFQASEQPRSVQGLFLAFPTVKLYFLLPWGGGQCDRPQKCAREEKLGNTVSRHQFIVPHMRSVKWVLMSLLVYRWRLRHREAGVMSHSLVIGRLWAQEVLLALDY